MDKVYVLIETNVISRNGAVYSVYSSLETALAAKKELETDNVSYYYRINTFDLDPPMNG